MLDLSMLAAPAPHWQPRASRRGTAIGNCVTGAAARNGGWALGRLDWCQNETWNPDVESAFFAKLERAKNKKWYLHDAAIAAFEAALACEDSNPLFRTWVYVELPVLIATERKRALYDRAVELLTKNRDRPHFPAELYKWHGAQALILHDRGKTAQALDEARQALKAAGMTHSGSQRHPKVGLVNDTRDTFVTRIKEIASEPSSTK